MARTPHKEAQLARLGQELRAGTWFKNSRHRSKRRRSPWNLLLLFFGFAFWVSIATLLGWAATRLHLALRPESVALFANGPLRLNTALVLFPAIFVAICPALLATNFVVYRIPPARRAMEAEDRGYPGVDYASSQRGLSKLGLWIGAIGVPVMLMGASIA